MTIKHRLALALAIVLLPLGGALAQQQPQPLRPLAEFKEPYSRVRGVVELPDGRVLVADQIEQAIYLADIDTRTKIGGNGAGPKEYRAPVGLFTARADTAWIHDLQNRRMVAVTPAGVVAPITMALDARSYVPHAADSLGRLYWDNSSTIRLNKRTDPKAEDAAIVRLNGSRLDTLTQFKVPGPVNPGIFADWDRWAIGPDGRIAIVRNQDDYRVDWLDARGTLTSGVRVNETRLRVTDEDRKLYADKVARREVPGGGTATTGATRPVRPPEITWPERFPYAQSVFVSPTGQAWVQRFRHIRDEAPLFDVFDARGRRVNSVTLPAKRTVIGFGRRHLFAVRTDEDGLQWLERYSVN